MNKILLVIITIVHILFMLFVIITPFTNSNYLLLMHAIVVPFMIFHWIVNDNTCALTIMEKHLRTKIYGKEPEKGECISARLIEPIYDFKNNHEAMSTFIYVVTVILWGISVYKLYSKYKCGEIRNFYDLMKF